jgi:hypothetical protein
MYELNHFRWSKLKGDLIQLVSKYLSFYSAGWRGGRIGDDDCADPKKGTKRQMPNTSSCFTCCHQKGSIAMGFQLCLNVSLGQLGYFSLQTPSPLFEMAEAGHRCLATCFRPSALYRSQSQIILFDDKLI